MKSGTIAIIGATSGLGQSVARQLANDNTKLLLVARDASKLSAVAADLSTRGAQISEVVADLALLSEHAQILTQLQDADHFFIFHSTLTDQAEAEKEWSVAQSSLNINLLSPLSLMHGIANRLEQQKHGSLVMVTSVAGDRGRGSNYWYGTAKGALTLHCQGLRNRLSKSGVNVLTVKPGFIDTAMTAHLPKTPAPLWATPDKVAGLIVSAWRANKNEIYTPGFWRVIMWVIKSIPETIFKRLSL